MSYKFLPLLYIYFSFLWFCTNWWFQIFDFTQTTFNCCSAGYAMWPAIVVDESLIGDRKGLTKSLGGRSVPVQFFGTHDFARFGILWHFEEILCILVHLPYLNSPFFFNLTSPFFYCDLYRIKVKQAISFLKGLLSSFHLKCKKPGFIKSLEEAKM